MEELILKNHNISKIILLGSATLFAAALIYFLTSLLPKDNSLNSAEDSLSSSLISEYVYYDISESSAQLFINFDNTKLSSNEIEVKCGETKAKLDIVNIDVEKDVYSIKNLKINTQYECYFTINEAFGDNTLHSLGYFDTTKRIDLNIVDVKFDAYDVGFNVVFRVSWAGDAAQYLVTKTKLNGKEIAYQNEVLLSRNNYLDNKVEVNSEYQYEIRALDEGKLGAPIFINVFVPAGERIEDNSGSASGKSLRILKEKLDIETSDLEEIFLADGNDIIASKYTHFIINESGFPILVNDLSNKFGHIYAGVISENKFKIGSIYIIENVLDDIIFNAILENNILSVEGSGDIARIRYYTPEGELLESDLLNGEATIDAIYDYIYLKTQQGLVKISQTKLSSQIDYSVETRRLSWDQTGASNKYGSFLLRILGDNRQPIFSVLLSDSYYVLDQQISEESITVEVLGYSKDGIVLLGSKQIKNIQSVLIPVEKLEMQKLGASLSIAWDSNNNYSYVIEIAKRGTARWQLIGETQIGSNSYTLRNVADLTNGEYRVRISPKNSTMVGSPTVAECYIRVSNLKDYQILCE